MGAGGVQPHRSQLTADLADNLWCVLLMLQVIHKINETHPFNSIQLLAQSKGSRPQEIGKLY